MCRKGLWPVSSGAGLRGACDVACAWGSVGVGVGGSGCVCGSCDGFGGGFTVEFDIQLYFRRAKQLQLSWWDSRYLEELVAASVLDVA